MFVVLGGSSFDHPHMYISSQTSFQISEVYGFRPTTKTWHMMGKLNQGRYGAGAIAIDNSKILILGAGNTGELCQVADKTDPAISCEGT